MARQSCTKIACMRNLEPPDDHGGGAHAGHSHARWSLPSGIERRLWVAIGAWALLTLVGLVVFWPGSAPASEYPDDPRVDGQVVAVTVQPCSGTAVEDLVECRLLEIAITSGPDAGDRTTLEQAITAGEGKVPGTGDRIVLTATRTPDGTIYQFADYQRSTAMWLLFAIFAAAVLALGRWRGAGALAGLAVSVVVLVGFILRALLEGSSPVAVALVGASVIAFFSLYLAHGVNSSTNVALLSTLLALGLTGVLAWLFIRMTTLTGLSDENTLFLEALGVHLDASGLLLAGVVIGSLGVLDDVTVTQVSAVGELRRARPDASAGELYRQALVIGRDHISSTVNTLFLAYAGAALPLLLLFTQAGAGVTDVMTREVVAIEIVRTLVGSIGLVASVPIATGLAAVVVAGRSVSRADGGGAASAGAAG
jgi:uncharacterized membrane protein